MRGTMDQRITSVGGGEAFVDQAIRAVAGGMRHLIERVFEWKRTKLLEVRVFDTTVKRAAYAKQTQEAGGNGTSNCPHCAIGPVTNKTRIYKFEEMHADHVSAWSRGGASTADNCQMLCVPHNRAKGNR